MARRGRRGACHGPREAGACPIPSALRLVESVGKPFFRAYARRGNLVGHKHFYPSNGEDVPEVEMRMVPEHPLRIRTVDAAPIPAAAGCDNCWVSGLPWKSADG